MNGNLRKNIFLGFHIQIKNIIGVIFISFPLKIKTCVIAGKRAEN